MSSGVSNYDNNRDLVLVTLSVNTNREGLKVLGVGDGGPSKHNDFIFRLRQEYMDGKTEKVFILNEFPFSHH